MRKFEITVTKRRRSDAEATADAALTCGPDASLTCGPEAALTCTVDQSTTAEPGALTCGPDGPGYAALTCGPDGPNYAESAGDGPTTARKADLSPLDDS
jgi:hypothetical protein